MIISESVVLLYLFLFFFNLLAVYFLEYAELSFKKQIHLVCFMIVFLLSIFLAVVFDTSFLFLQCEFCMKDQDLESENQFEPVSSLFTT